VKTSWTIGFALLVAAACVGCSSAPVTSPTPSPAVETATHALDVTATVEGETFSNPVLDRDFPDPDVLNVDGTYYAFATNSGSSNIQAAESTDLVHWTMLPDALPQLPAWAVQDFGWVWAPEVFFHPAQLRYHMFFVARYAMGSGGMQCIGAATSPEPEGPFTPVGAAPVVCQTGQGGSIDPAYFLDDDGQAYLL
jgi:arabinan endo-1,5-alpha-L-arabinosidase